MKRSLDNSSTPGSSCEPENERYCKIPASGSGFITTRRKIMNELTLPRLDRKKSILNTLSSNQMGSMEPLSYQCEVSSLRLKNLSLDREYVYPKADKGLKIRYLRKGVKHLYGQWVSPMVGTAFYAFGYFPDVSQDPMLPLREAHNYEVKCIPSQIVIIDMCEGYAHPLCLLYVGNDPHTGHGMARLNWHRLENNRGRNTAQHYYLSSRVYCCCSNEFTGYFALGVEDGVKINSPNCFMHTVLFSITVLGAHFNKMGTIIYAGLNDGRLLALDLREHVPVDITKYNEFAITDVALLDNENYILCAGLSNFLAKVDLRMKRKVVNYLGDSRRTFKNPFSFDETANVLCSTGSDNITRLWSLNGGNPIKSIPPPIPEEKCLSWVMVDPQSKISVHMVSKDMVYIHEC